MISYHQHPLDFFASLATPLKRFFTEIAKVQDRQTREAHLWMEAEERLAQLDFLIVRSKKLQDQHSKVMRAQCDAVKSALAQSRSARDQYLKSRASRRRCSLASELVFELKLSTEAFYYFAARFITILKCFPQFKSFAAPGVRDVRNRLIEHAEKADGVTHPNWGYTVQTGPFLKCSTFTPPAKTNVPNDAGLFVNAAELRDRLQLRLADLLDPSRTTRQPQPKL